MATRWGLVEILSSPMQPEKCIIHLYLPDMPGMRTILYIKLIADVQLSQFLHELLRVRVVGLIFRRRTNIHV
jgi:hypothetical protein